MNPEGFAVFIPIVALCIPVAGIIFHGLEKVARLRVEEAKVRAGQLDGQSTAELATLRDEWRALPGRDKAVEALTALAERGALRHARDGLPFQR